MRKGHAKCEPTVDQRLEGRAPGEVRQGVDLQDTRGLRPRLAPELRDEPFHAVFVSSVGRWEVLRSGWVLLQWSDPRSEMPPDYRWLPWADQAGNPESPGGLCGYRGLPLLRASGLRVCLLVDWVGIVGLSGWY